MFRKKDEVYNGMFLSALMQFPIGLWHRLTAPSADITTQQQVNLPSFMGRWFEQARFDNFFEHGMDDVYSDYSLTEDNQFSVMNCGTTTAGVVKQIRGMGKVRDRRYPGKAEVSFVPPYKWFAAPYLILYTDSEYREALVAGSGGRYLWLLTREQYPEKASIQRLLRVAQSRGFDIRRLRLTEHQKRKSTPADIYNPG